MFSKAYSMAFKYLRRTGHRNRAIFQTNRDHVIHAVRMAGMINTGVPTE
jgi:hypothetical protein